MGERHQRGWLDQATDGVLAGSLVAWGLAEVVNEQTEVLVGPKWANAVTFVAMSLALLVRRRRPVACLVFQCACMGVLVVACGGTTESLGWVLPLVAGIYAVAAYAPRWRVLGAAAPTAALILLQLGVNLTAGQIVGGDLLGSLPFVGLLAAGWLWGTFARTRRLYVVEVERSAALLAAQREERAHRNAAQERNRIARELHDVLAHGLAVTVRQAEAGEARLNRDTEAARASFQAIADVGRRSLADVRSLMTVLQEPTADVSVCGDLEQLDELAASLSTAGLTVLLRRTGDSSKVPNTVANAAFRIVQEALTNAMRHGRAHTAWVTLNSEPGRLKVEVRDDGQGAAGTPIPGGGLTGMSARAALCGGTFSAGTSDDGGFIVTASLTWDHQRGRR